MRPEENQPVEQAEADALLSALLERAGEPLPHDFRWAAGSETGRCAHCGLLSASSLDESGECSVLLRAKVAELVGAMEGPCGSPR